mgnify:CR=1 FL=1
MEKIGNDYHIPVLYSETLDNLVINPDGIYIDCTLGGGSHSEGILERLSDKGLLISIDQDSTAIEYSKKRLEKLSLNIEDIDLFEMNEAFAAQSIAVTRLLNLDTTKVNTRGGAIALGHPIGASGCRVLVTLVHALIKDNKEKGLCSLCIGGGQGISMVVSRK